MYTTNASEISAICVLFNAQQRSEPWQAGTLVTKHAYPSPGEEGLALVDFRDTDIPMTYPSMRRLYLEMRPAWRWLWEFARKRHQDEKQAWRDFLWLRASTTLLSSDAQVRLALRRLAWSWYHTETPALRYVHPEVKLITDGHGRRVGDSAYYMILTELLTVIDPEELPRLARQMPRRDLGRFGRRHERVWIDQRSSEANWRRGLHTERAGIVLCEE